MQFAFSTLKQKIHYISLKHFTLFMNNSQVFELNDEMLMIHIYIYTFRYLVSYEEFVFLIQHYIWVEDFSSI